MTSRLGLLPRLFGSALALAAIAGIALAQQKAQALDPARIAAIKEMMTAQGSDAQFDTVIDTMTRGMAGMLRQQHPGHAKDIDEVFARLAAKFASRKGEIVEMIAPLYAERFNVEEIKQITAFYKSSIGLKVVEEQPQIMQKSMQMGMVWGQRIGQEVEREAREELKKKGLPL